jgi:hypothetical protein
MSAGWLDGELSEEIMLSMNIRYPFFDGNFSLKNNRFVSVLLSKIKETYQNNRLWV